MSPADNSADYTVLPVDEVRDHYADSQVPGEFRPLSEALGTQQLAVSQVRIAPHSDFDQSTGHHHEETEEIYLVTRGTLTMRFGDEIRHVSAPAAVRVAAQTPRATYRNEGDEAVEVWAVSRAGGRDATKITDFWDASPHAAQTR